MIGGDPFRKDQSAFVGSFTAPPQGAYQDGRGIEYFCLRCGIRGFLNPSRDYVPVCVSCKQDEWWMKKMSAYLATLKSSRPKREREQGKCKRGHYIYGHNAAVNADGRARCRVCRRARSNTSLGIWSCLTMEEKIENELARTDGDRVLVAMDALEGGK